MDFRFSAGKIHPVDILRRRLTRGLEVAIGDQPARRGGEVEALVTISNARKLGELEVGVVCTEYYDEQETTREANGATSVSRSTSDEVVHESWNEVESVLGQQGLRFTIPADAPFSYSGECLSFKWEVVARGRRSGRLDAQARSEFSVLP
jgi:hypothetical protein